MKLILLALSIVLICSVSTSAQTTATDFTATDCASASHTSFTELNAGKVVVLVWIMPCSACINDAKGAFDAVQSFATSNPGKVLYYLMDDLGDAGCTTLNTWASINGIMGATIFSNTGNVIDENNYGGNGMPHIVVVGGTNHKIYINLRNGENNETAIRNAIASALSPTSVGKTSKDNVLIRVYPIPTSGNLTIECFLSQADDVTLDIFDVRGVKVQSVTEYLGAGQQTINLLLEQSLANGYYLARVSTSDASTVSGFTIAR